MSTEKETKTRERRSEMLRLRVGPALKERVQRLADKRACDVADVVREGLVSFVEDEEARLNLSGNLLEAGGAN